MAPLGSLHAASKPGYASVLKAQSEKFVLEENSPMQTRIYSYLNAQNGTQNTKKSYSTKMY